MFTKIQNKIRQVAQSFRSPEAVIAEIHNEFDTATEKILEEAKRILAGEYDSEKAQRLHKLGFYSAKRVMEAYKMDESKKENKKLAELICYYQQHYPNNKFITEDKVREICKKYGLICGSVGRYIADVPENNLSEIEVFSLREQEMNRKVCHWWERSTDGRGGMYNACTEKKNDHTYWGWLEPSPYGATFHAVDESKPCTYLKDNMMICAPIKDFNTVGMGVKDGYRLRHLPDPIVLQPVKGGYLVVTKWGLEAEDENL